MISDHGRGISSTAAAGVAQRFLWFLDDIDYYSRIFCHKTIARASNTLE